MARGAGRGNYSMETIILNISVKRGGGRLFRREAIRRGIAIIRGNTVPLGDPFCNIFNTEPMVSS